MSNTEKSLFSMIKKRVVLNFYCPCDYVVQSGTLAKPIV